MRSIAVGKAQHTGAPATERIQWARVAIRAGELVAEGEFASLKRAADETGVRAHIILHVDADPPGDFTPDHTVSAALVALPTPWERVFLLALDTGVGRPGQPFLRGVTETGNRRDALFLRHHRSVLTALEPVIPLARSPLVREIGERWVELLPLLP